MQTKTSYYDVLVDLALQFVEHVKELNDSILPTLSIQTTSGNQGFCKYKVTSSHYLFYILQGESAYEAYCQYENQIKHKSHQRLIEKSKIRQTQVMLKISKPNQFYAHEPTMHLKDELACSMSLRKGGHEVSYLVTKEAFDLIVDGLTSWLNSFESLKSLETACSDCKLVYQLDESTKMLKQYQPIPTVSAKQFPLNELLLYQIQKLPQVDEIWEGAQYYLMDQCVCSQPKNQGYPFQTLIVSKKTKQKIFVEVSETDEMLTYLIMHFLYQVELIGYRPSTLIVDDQEMLMLFEIVCEKLNITCLIGDVKGMLNQSVENVSPASTFDLAVFYDETKNYCDYVMEHLHVIPDSEDALRFINNVTIFRFQMFIYTSKYELNWTSKHFEEVLTLLVTRFDKRVDQHLFLTDVLSYVMIIRQHLFIPYADQFKLILTNHLQQLKVDETHCLINH